MFPQGELFGGSGPPPAPTNFQTLLEITANSLKSLLYVNYDFLLLTNQRKMVFDPPHFFEVATLLTMSFFINLHQLVGTVADPEGGHRGHVPPPPPLEKMGSHNLPRTDEFFRGGGDGGGVTWSLEKVKTIYQSYILSE